MPLSDEEQRLLEQMERALVEEDPKFASTLRGTRFARATRFRLVVSGVAFVVGVVLLMSGVVLGAGAAVQAVLGVVGFVVMLASATLGLNAWHHRQASSEQEDREAADADGGQSGLSLIQGGKDSRKAKPGKGRTKRSSGGSFMQRMEDRWQRRRGDNGY
ncbi:membrane protein [Marmoricola endophyticus]|uniref:Membrane protein n=1 Tax=Marmoricola endophyticus TaxID=2040280 RepID=A0A917EZV5_9ACTN|nr:DUF3040 domain-containing protein [Marmoricola endophyticus]GGF38027.1 membrane protein [Marmoricola endophyticus]